MTKYEIYTDSFEFRMGTRESNIPSMSADEIFDTYMSCDTRITSNSLDPEMRESFEDESEAVAFFNAHYANYGRTSLEHGNSEYLLRGEIAWVERNEYDEDGEFDQGGDVVAISAEAFEPDEPTDAEMMQVMVADWMSDNADEMEDLVLDGKPYYDEELSTWVQECHDSGTACLLVDHDGSISIEYVGAF